jgi:hypothetical protein
MDTPLEEITEGRNTWPRMRGWRTARPLRKLLAEIAKARSLAESEKAYPDKIDSEGFFLRKNPV